ncbi:unnamed protein product, partial [marine sediment metagenome]
FRVSSFPQIVAGTDKLYTAPEHLYAEIAFGLLAAGGFFPFAQFGAGDQLGTELRLVGGDVITPTVTVVTLPTAGVDLTVTFILFGRKARVLVEP